MLKRIYGFHFKSERRERLFLASLAFLLTFAIVRGITHLIRAGIGPFHNVSSGGLHIHHLVWGILLLLVVGYIWLIEAGHRLEPARPASTAARSTASALPWPSMSSLSGSTSRTCTGRARAGRASTLS